VAEWVEKYREQPIPNAKKEVCKVTKNLLRLVARLHGRALFMLLGYTWNTRGVGQAHVWPSSPDVGKLLDDDFGIRLLWEGTCKGFERRQEWAPNRRQHVDRGATRERAESSLPECDARVKQWLDEHGMAKFCDKFAVADCKWEYLHHLEQSDLERMGIPIAPAKVLARDLKQEALST
jgi:hypothetical protein